MRVHTHTRYKFAYNCLIRLISEVRRLVKIVSIIKFKGYSLLGQVIGFNFKSERFIYANIRIAI